MRGLVRCHLANCLWLFPVVGRHGAIGCGDHPTSKFCGKPIIWPRSGDFSSWWDIEVELRSVGYQMAPDLLNNERTREQLDRLCAEAKEMRRHA